MSSRTRGCCCDDHSRFVELQHEASSERSENVGPAEEVLQLEVRLLMPPSSSKVPKTIGEVHGAY